MTEEDKEEILKSWNVLGMTVVKGLKSKDDFYSNVEKHLGWKWNGENWEKVSD